MTDPSSRAEASAALWSAVSSAQDDPAVSSITRLSVLAVAAGAAAGLGIGRAARGPMTAVVGSAVGAVSGALLAFEEGTRRLCDLDGAAGDAARRYRRVTRGAGRLEDPEAARLRRKMEEMQKEQAVRIAKVDLQAFVESRPQWLELLEEFKSNQMEVRRQLVVHESSQGTRQMEP